MPIFSREYRREDDFQAVLSYLRDTYSQTASLHNWLPPRFENSGREMESGTHIWEACDGEKRPRILAVATPEAKLRYFIQIHPDYSFLEDEILQWIEEYSVLQSSEPGKLRLSVVALEGNPAREAALRKHGFVKGPVYGILRLRDVDAPIPGYRIPDGFKIRSVDPETDFKEIASSIRAVFGHGDWFTKEVLEATSRASFYHEDLDLVAVDPDGKIASFCTFRLDSPSGITELEPMGTLPEYRGRGIAKALLCEGFKRLKKHDPTLLYIGGAADTQVANRLYEVTGFTDKYDYFFWDKMM
jgi:ribosomal protein S18 acetylase RimI-like enzyme